MAIPNPNFDQFLAPDREKREPTPAMQLGTALHTAVLEPHGRREVSYTWEDPTTGLACKCRIIPNLTHHAA